MSVTLRLLIADRLVRAELVRRRRTVWAGERACEAPERLREAIAQLAGEAAIPRKGVRLTAVVGSPPLQVRTLRGLPPVAPKELRELISAHAGRYFRRNGKPLVTDAAWLGANARREGLATAVAVEEPWIEAVLAGAAEAGFEVRGIGPDLEGARGTLALLSASERHRRERRMRLTDRRLARAAAMVWIALTAGLVARFEQERRAIRVELARLEAPARAMADARRALEDAAAMVTALETADRDRGAVIQRIGAIAAELPDSAYLSSLTLDVFGAGSLSGEARRSAQALARLEAEGALVSPRPVGPVTSESDGARVWERFSVSFGSEVDR